MLSDVVTAQEMDPFADHILARLIGRMRLAREHELHGIFLIGENPRQPLRIVQQQVGPFVGGEPTRKAERKCVGIEDRSGFLESPMRRTPPFGVPFEGARSAPVPGNCRFASSTAPHQVQL